MVYHPGGLTVMPTVANIPGWLTSSMTWNNSGARMLNYHWSWASAKTDEWRQHCADENPSVGQV